MWTCSQCGQTHDELPLCYGAEVPEASWAQYAAAWQTLGATHLDVAAAGAGLASPQDHVAALRRVKNALGM